MAHERDIDQRDGHRDHGSRVGRHPRAQHAAAAVVALDVLLTIVWSIGYWIVYPSWPLVSSYTVGLFNWHSREAVIADHGGAQGAARSDGGTACGRRRSRRSSPTRTCPNSRARRGGRCSWKTARRVTAAVAAAPRAIRTCSTTNGCGVGASRISRSPSAMAFVPRRARSARAACRRSDATASSSGRTSRRSTDYVRSLAGLAAEPGRQSGARQAGLRRNLRRLSRRRRQGQPRDRSAKSHRRDLALWFRSGLDHRRPLERSWRHDAGLGRPARRKHDQGADDLRPHPRRRREVTDGARRSRTSSVCPKAPGPSPSSSRPRPSVHRARRAGLAAERR